jgi:hypothetical protein
MKEIAGFRCHMAQLKKSIIQISLKRRIEEIKKSSFGSLRC